MRILVTGGSSFVGAHLCRLGSARHEMIALYNNTQLTLSGIDAVRCDLRDPEAPARLSALRADAVVHLAFRVKRRGPTPHSGDPVSDLNHRMMDCVLGLGLPVVYASSTVVHWPADTAYGRDRREDEARVREHAAPWAILRPCAPYGPELPGHRPAHRESFHVLARLVSRSPVVPIIGDGHYRRQPIHVDDFNGAILALLERGLPNAAFDAGGADALTFNDIVDILARLGSRCVHRLHIPKPVFSRLARFTKDFDPELISAIDSDEVVDPAPLAEASGLAPRLFEDGARCLI